MPVGADTIAAIAPATRGPSLSVPLLEHSRHKQVGHTQWEKVDRGPWASSSTMVA